MPQFSRHNRRGRVVIAIGLSALLLGTSACTRIRTHQGYQVDKLLVDSVQPGIDNRASVEGTLGRPSFVSQFGQQDWYYVSRDMRALAFSSPKPVDQTVLRVRFDAAGNVVAVDRTGLDQVASISPMGDKTPTLGRHRSLFDEIFGNIGAVGAGGMGGGGGSGPGGGPNGS
ncbi:outer membrane protein assembly factor BamE [Sphingobium sp. C100]|jgi:outer membrane protein assembly factor BamE (lipoprotein component of BamABCDE complex)|uniref:outer membrane protein assembly factor BamE n=1 Tax=Sphingobium sp. C100 TaxID=1207055 RepID=UPI00040F255F|nr:outer membrane protein assembly factor BamE [Sphingobium sp. C100]